MNKNTLYITFDGLTDPLGQSQIIPYLSGIAAHGFHITVLSCEKEKNLNSIGPDVEKVLSKHGIKWKSIKYDESGGPLSRFRYVNTLKNMAMKIYEREPFKLVHCRSYLSSLIGLYFKRRYHVPFIFDMRGFWADERIDGGIWRKKNPLHLLLYKYFKRKEEQFLSESDAIISLTLAGWTELRSKYKFLNATDKVYIIPCCTNTEVFDPNAISPASIEHVNEKDNLVIYTGSIGTWYYTKELIDCAIVWQKIIPGFKLLFLTKDIPALHSILSSYPGNVRDFIITASANYKDVPRFLKAARASVFFIKPAYSKIASSPTKMAECWAMNLPIITNTGIGDNDIYFKEEAGGVLINDFTKEEYIKAGEKLKQLLMHKGNYRSIALANFDLKKGIDTYVAVYKKLTDR